jgi:predicted  nucleic acid-binding Zn-ribbon protein
MYYSSPIQSVTNFSPCIKRDELMESSQFETLILAITGLKSEFTGLKSEVSGIKADLSRLETKMDTGFAEVRKDLKSIREQVALTHVDVTELKTRVSTLEGPRA